jgi:hypothetical protein
MRALITWMATISGNVNTMLHNIEKPNWAPACE